MHCDQCEMVSINGVACHEFGCPNRYKEWDPEDKTWDETFECCECGQMHDDIDEADRCCAERDDFEDYDPYQAVDD